MRNWIWWQAVRGRHAWRVAQWRWRWAMARRCVRAAGRSRFAPDLRAMETACRTERRAISDWFTQQHGRLRPGGEAAYQFAREMDALAEREPEGGAAFGGLGAPLMSRDRDEWYGINSPSGSDCYPAPADADGDWLGTSARPYANTKDVGRRRR